MVSSVVPLLGIDFTVVTPATPSGVYTPAFTVGATTIASDGNHYEYVSFAASTTVTAGDSVTITSAGAAASMTKTNVDLGLRKGICPYAVASNTAVQYGWVIVPPYANASCRAADGSSANAAVYTTATAGVLATTSTSQTKITGVIFATANSSGAIALRAMTDSATAL